MSVAIAAIAFVGWLAHSPPTAKLMTEKINNIEGVEAELNGDDGFVLFMPGLVFELGKHNVTKNHLIKIKQVVEILNTNGIEDDVVYFGGHSSALGSDEYNLRLSNKRAKSVMKAYESQGLSPLRSVSKGYGESKPRFQPPEDERNQRVEVVVVDLK